MLISNYGSLTKVYDNIKRNPIYINSKVTSYMEKYVEICGTVKKKRGGWGTNVIVDIQGLFFSCDEFISVLINLIINSQLSRCRHREEAGWSTGRGFKEEPGMFKHILTDQTTDIIRSAQPVRMNGIYIDCIKV